MMYIVHVINSMCTYIKKHVICPEMRTWWFVMSSGSDSLQQKLSNFSHVFFAAFEANTITEEQISTISGSGSQLVVLSKTNVSLI